MTVYDVAIEQLEEHQVQEVLRQASAVVGVDRLTGHEMWLFHAIDEGSASDVGVRVSLDFRSADLYYVLFVVELLKGDLCFDPARRVCEATCPFSAN